MKVPTAILHRIENKMAVLRSNTLNPPVLMANRFNRLKFYDRVCNTKRAFRIQVYKRSRRTWAVFVGKQCHWEYTCEMSNGQRFV